MISVAVSTDRWLGMRMLEALEAAPVEVRGVHFDGLERRRYPGDPTFEDFEALSRRTGWQIVSAAPALPGADILVSALTSHIFTADELANYGQAVNLHPAQLPQYQGCNSYSWAIENDEPYYGVTLHHMVPGIDRGPIIAQRFVPVLDDDTAWRLYQRAQCAAQEMWCAELPRLLEAALFRQPMPSREQDETYARYFRRESRPEQPTERAWEFA